MGERPPDLRSGCLRYASAMRRLFVTLLFLPFALFAQGALALQVRAGEEELVAHADDDETRRRVEAERACVAIVGAGCLAPVAAHHDGTMLHALIAAEDGSWVERRVGDDPIVLAEQLVAYAQ